MSNKSKLNLLGSPVWIQDNIRKRLGSGGGSNSSTIEIEDELSTGSSGSESVDNENFHHNNTVHHSKLPSRPKRDSTHIDNTSSSSSESESDAEDEEPDPSWVPDQNELEDRQKVLYSIYKKRKQSHNRIKRSNSGAVMDLDILKPAPKTDSEMLPCGTMDSGYLSDSAPQKENSICRGKGPVIVSPTKRSLAASGVINVRGRAGSGAQSSSHSIMKESGVTVMRRRMEEFGQTDPSKNGKSGAGSLRLKLKKRASHASGLGHSGSTSAGKEVSSLGISSSTVTTSSNSIGTDKKHKRRSGSLGRTFLKGMDKIPLTKPAMIELRLGDGETQKKSSKSSKKRSGSTVGTSDTGSVELTNETNSEKSVLTSSGKRKKEKEKEKRAKRAKRSKKVKKKEKKKRIES